MPKRFRQVRNVDEILKSAEMQAILEGLGEQVLAAAKDDPNKTYTDSLELHVFASSSRVSVQVGAAPGIGTAVEAKRGTLARALGSVS